MERPRLNLTLHRLTTACIMDDGFPKRVPLVLDDIQDLLMHAMNTRPKDIKWCKLTHPSQIQNVLVLEASGLDASHFPRYFRPTSFNTNVEVISPTLYNSSVVAELFRLPSDPLSISPLSGAACSEPMRPFTRLQLLLSPQDMFLEPYPMPVPFPGHAEPYSDYVFTKNKYTDVTSTSPMFAVDCEMCLTSSGERELAWIVVTDENYDVIYETFVKPRNPIRDYLTRFSGITAPLMRDVTTRLEDVHTALQQLLPPDAILCGHSLNRDLKAMKMYHPYIIDTSTIYNLSGRRERKPGLKALTERFLGRQIQKGTQGHNPTVDAVCAMQLVRLKLQQGIRFGNALLGGQVFPSRNLQLNVSKTTKVAMRNISAVTDSGNSQSPRDENADRVRAFLERSYSNGSFVYRAKDANKRVAVIGRSNVLRNHKDDWASFIPTSSDEESVSSLKTALQDNYMVYTELNTCSKLSDPSLPTDETQAMCQKLDKIVSSMLKNLQAITLVTLILPGNTTRLGHGRNSFCFFEVVGI